MRLLLSPKASGLLLQAESEQQLPMECFMLASCSYKGMGHHSNFEVSLCC